MSIRTQNRTSPDGRTALVWKTETTESKDKGKRRYNIPASPYHTDVDYRIDRRHHRLFFANPLLTPATEKQIDNLLDMSRNDFEALCRVKGSCLIIDPNDLKPRQPYSPNDLAKKKPQILVETEGSPETDSPSIEDIEDESSLFDAIYDDPDNGD